MQARTLDSYNFDAVCFHQDRCGRARDGGAERRRTDPHETSAHGCWSKSKTATTRTRCKTCLRTLEKLEYAGYFVLNGALWDADHFDPRVHQDQLASAACKALEPSRHIHQQLHFCPSR